MAGRLNELHTVNEPYFLGELSDAQVEELAKWFSSLTNNKDAYMVKAVPEFYRPTLAYMQMSGMGIDLGDMTPWTMPRHIADHYAAVWLANRKGVLLANEKLEKAGRSGQRSRSSGFGQDFIVKPDSHGGHA